MFKSIYRFIKPLLIFVYNLVIIIVRVVCVSTVVFLFGWIFKMSLCLLYLLYKDKSNSFIPAGNGKWIIATAFVVVIFAFSMSGLYIDTDEV